MYALVYVWCLREELSTIFVETGDYLGPKTVFVVISNPLVLFDGVWNFLVLNQVDTGTLKERANLKKKRLNFKFETSV